jgi:putative oxidoreductase
MSVISAQSQRETELPGSTITDWVLRVGVAVFFFAVGFEKFTAGPRSEWIRIFAQIGWGDWFRYFTGMVETLGALLMLVPKATMAGTALLAAAMLGAILAHCFKLGDPFSSLIPLALLVLVVVVGRKLSSKPEGFTRIEL